MADVCSYLFTDWIERHVLTWDNKKKRMKQSGDTLSITDNTQDVGVSVWRWTSPGHVKEERILHHKPATRPAEAELMMSDTVEPLDAVTPWSFQNITFTVGKKRYQIYILATMEKYWSHSTHRPLGPRSLMKDNGLIARKSIWEHNTQFNMQIYITSTILCNFVFINGWLETTVGPIPLEYTTSVGADEVISDEWNNAKSLGIKVRSVAQEVVSKTCVLHWVPQRSDDCEERVRAWDIYEDVLCLCSGQLWRVTP